MMKMVRCETEREYEDLWRELNKAMMDEPFLPKKYVKDNVDMDWTKTPELQMVIAEKEQELEEDRKRKEAESRKGVTVKAISVKDFVLKKKCIFIYFSMVALSGQQSCPGHPPPYLKNTIS